MTNMTYAEAINIAIAAIGDESNPAAERLNTLKAQLAKRGSKGGQTKTQKANEILKSIILEVLEQAQDFVPMDVIREDERLVNFSTQKLGALMAQLIKDDKAKKVIHKKKTLYAAADVEWIEPTPDTAE